MKRCEWIFSSDAKKACSDTVWEDLSYDEKNRRLLKQEKRMLDMFLERRAITKEQYEKGFRELQCRLPETGTD